MAGRPAYRPLVTADYRGTHIIRKLSVIGKDEGEEMPCRLFRRFQAINRTTNASSVKNCNFVCLFFEWGIDAAYLALFH